MTEPQFPLFMENYDDAIRATVLALGGNKAVGNMLWPAKDPELAGRQLSNALNHRKREVLEPNELAMIRRAARAKGIHILATFEMQDAGYAAPQPIEPEDARAALQREFTEGVKRLEQLATRLGRIG